MLTHAQVQLTEQQLMLRGEQFCPQCVMLPHDIVATLYNYPEIFHSILTGEPGRIEEYWRQNQDLLESLQMPGLDPGQDKIYF